MIVTAVLRWDRITVSIRPSPDGLAEWSLGVFRGDICHAAKGRADTIADALESALAAVHAAAEELAE